MAPKEPFKVHSLSKHIEETKKGLNAPAPNKKPFAKSVTKKEASGPAASIFNDNNDSDSDSSSSSSSDDSDSDVPSYMKNLAKPQALKRRSQEDEIADSDAERISAAPKPKPAKEAAKAAKASPPSDDTSSEASSEGSEKKVSSKGAALGTATSTTSPTSSSGSDSDSNSGSESSSSEDDSDSDDAESESESETAGAKKPADKPVVNGTMAATKAKPKPTESDNDSDDSEESSDESEDGAESSDEESADEPRKVAEGEGKSMQVAERGQAGRATLPRSMPPHFQLRTSDQQSNGQDVARVCNEAYLEGKQLWYFTLPADVPVSVVENLEFPLDASQQGDSILRHNGEDYAVSFDSKAPTKSIQILIPSADGSTYQHSRPNTDEVMQIRRITQIPVTTATPENVGSSIKVARPQPAGLTARFQPMGVTSSMGTIGAPESHKTFQKKDKKRDGASDPKESTKKSKTSKRKHSVSEDDGAAAAEQLMEESVSAASKSKKQKTARRGSPDLGSRSSAPAARQSFVVPPPIPGSSGTVPPATPGKKAKTSKSATNPATPAHSSPAPGSSMKKETPVPVPMVPGSSAGKTKKSKDKAAPTRSPV